MTLTGDGVGERSDEVLSHAVANSKVNQCKENEGESAKVGERVILLAGRACIFRKCGIAPQCGIASWYRIAVGHDIAV
jgi:hypothetical protein